MKRYLNLVIGALLCFAPATVAQESEIPASALVVARFSQADLSQWDEKAFEGNTRYSLVSLDGEQVLKAESESSASGLFREMEVDLGKTPFINWRWSIERPLDIEDETIKSGDDYAARIYIVHKTGVLPWSLIAVNYVWSSAHPIGKTWKSAVTDKACLIAVESGGDKAGRWQMQKRNVLQDFKTCFGEDIQKIDAVAIMTDTDNSKGSAVAYYGDIYFSTD